MKKKGKDKGIVMAEGREKENGNVGSWRTEGILNQREVYNGVHWVK